MKYVFFDVETTGLHSDDRVVSLGALSLDEETLLAGKGGVDVTHLVFDPGKRSHPRAEQVHGYDDWFLRHQSPFSDYADELHRFFSAADRIVAHNASFDSVFLQREFVLAGFAPMADAKFYCTMMEFRKRFEGPSSLDAILARIGRRRRSNLHGALEDAFYAALVYCALNKVPGLGEHEGFFSGPTNTRKPPQHPGFPLPRRSEKQRGQATRWRQAYDQTLAVKQEARPLAIVLMYAAHANGSFSEHERRVVAEYIFHIAEKNGIPNTETVVQDIAAETYALQPNQDDLMSAVADLAISPQGQVEAMRWLERLVAADGEIDAEEHFVLNEVRLAFDVIFTLQ